MPVDIITPPPQNTVIKTIDNVNLELPIGIAILPESGLLGLAVDILIQNLRNEYSISALS